MKKNLCLVILGLFSITQIKANANEIYNSILDDYRQSVVTIEAVIETEIRAGGQSQESENRIEVPGVLLNDDGLVMASSRPFSSDFLEDALAGTGQQFQTNVSISDITIVLDDGEDFDAFVVATDSDFELAFLQMEDIEYRSFPFVELNESADIDKGDKLYTLARLGEEYDYAPHVRYLLVEGEVDRPREAWIATAYPNLIGMPFFNEDGEPAGVLASLDVESDHQPAGGFGGMINQLHGGDDPTLNFVVPVDEISGLINQAEERAEEMLDDR